jgi:hypothetical protein
MNRKFSRLRPSPEALSQAVAGETVLLDLRSEKYFGLNAVGTRVWDLLQETDDVRAIRERLLAEYEVAEAQLDADLDELLGRLLAAGLVTPASDAPKTR